MQCQACGFTMEENFDECPKCNFKNEIRSVSLYKAEAGKALKNVLFLFIAILMSGLIFLNAVAVFKINAIFFVALVLSIITVIGCWITYAGAVRNKFGRGRFTCMRSMPVLLVIMHFCVIVPLVVVLFMVLCLGEVVDKVSNITGLFTGLFKIEGYNDSFLGLLSNGAAVSVVLIGVLIAMVILSLIRFFKLLNIIDAVKAGINQQRPRKLEGSMFITLSFIDGLIFIACETVLGKALGLLGIILCVYGIVVILEGVLDIIYNKKLNLICEEYENEIQVRKREIARISSQNANAQLLLEFEKMQNLREMLNQNTKDTNKGE